MNSKPKENMEQIVHQVCNGGSLNDFAAIWSIDYAYVWQWVESDTDRALAHKTAIETRNKIIKEEILAELRACATADIRKLYDENGKLLKPNKWPEAIVPAVIGYDVSEDGFARVKLTDKLKGIETHLKATGEWVDKKEVSGKFTIADLVGMSFEGDKSGSSENKS